MISPDCHFSASAKASLPNKGLDTRLRVQHTLDPYRWLQAGETLQRCRADGDLAGRGRRSVHAEGQCVTGRSPWDPPASSGLTSQPAPGPSLTWPHDSVTQAVSALWHWPQSDARQHFVQQGNEPGTGPEGHRAWLTLKCTGPAAGPAAWPQAGGWSQAMHVILAPGSGKVPSPGWPPNSMALL